MIQAVGTARDERTNGTPTGEEPADPAPRVWPRLAAHAVWMVALAVLVQLGIGRFGFNPTDQGFILGQSWRILHGAVPHVDMISARPLGSPLLHVVDLLLPGPLYLVSGMLTALEIVVTAVALTALLTGRPVRTWGVGLAAVAAAVALLDINNAPVMAWHTTDGLLLSALGWWALDSGLRSGRAWPRRIGLLLLGFAVMTKQSFAPAPLIGVAMLALHPAPAARAGRWSGRWWGRTVVDLICLCAVPVLYVAWVTAAGGLGTMITQLTGGMPADDKRLLLNIWTHATAPGTLPVRRSLLVLIALAALLLVLRVLLVRLPAAGRWADRVLVLAGLAGLAWLLYAGRLAFDGDWGLVLWWAALAMTVLDGLVRRRFPARPLLVVALAAMCSLSWGADSPTDLAGGLALTVVFVLVTGSAAVEWRSAPALRTGARALGGVVVLAVAAAGVTVAHDRAPYRDLPRDRLTADLGASIPAMAGIRSNPSTATYLRQIADCVAGHPAAKVAVLGDNPFVYPALRLDNPFPMDWPLPAELVGDARARMLAEAGTLDRQGDYLVLFQTVSAATLTVGGPVPAHIAPTTPITGNSDLEAAIHDRLTGRHLTCGSFQAIYAPHP